MEVSFTIPIQLVYLAGFLWEVLPGALLALWCSGALALSGLFIKLLITTPGRFTKKQPHFMRMLLVFGFASFIAVPMITYEAIKDIVKKMEQNNDQ